jgi:hypothetical protein
MKVKSMAMSAFRMLHVLAKLDIVTARKLKWPGMAMAEVAERNYPRVKDTPIL